MKDYIKALLKALKISLLEAPPSYGRGLAAYHAKPDEYGPTLSAACPKCGNKAYWHLYRYRSWLLFGVLPVFPYRSDYYLRCMKCEENILLSQSEARKAIDLSRFTQAVLAGRHTPVRPDPMIETALIRRIEGSQGDQINTDASALWNSYNDQFCEAIKLSNYKPQTAIDKINELLLVGVNINAKNSAGRTLLSIARYYEAPKAILDIVKNAGGE